MGYWNPEFKLLRALIPSTHRAIPPRHLQRQLLPLGHGKGHIVHVEEKGLIRRRQGDRACGRSGTSFD